MKLNVDDVDVESYEPTTYIRTEDARSKRRTGRRRRPRPRHRVNSLFGDANVHIYIGGTPDGAKFVGCIGNVHIMNDKWHPGLLTEGARCGIYGNAKCVGKPLFNKCNTGSPLNRVSVALNPTGGPKREISALQFTGVTGVAVPDASDEIVEMVPVETPRRRGKKGRNRNRQFGNRNRDTVLGIDAVQAYDNDYDQNCQLPMNPDTSGYYYPGDGYSKYSVTNFNSWNWRFSLKMRTEAKVGIIFFMCSTGCPEHIAVYLVKGKIVFSVKFGTERRRIKTNDRYNDGYWHHITFQRKRENLQMIIDDTMINTEFYESGVTFSTLMLFYIGGLQALEKREILPFMSRTHLTDFTGCIQNLAVNDEPIQTSESSFLLVKTNLRPCFDGDTEPGIFFSNSHQSEEGSYMLVYNTYTVGDNLEVTMEIRPRAQFGVLLAVGGTIGNFFQLMLIEGKVVARVKQETDVLMSVYDPSDYGYAMCDGEWHKVKVIKAKNILALNVDGNPVSSFDEGDIAIRSCDTDGPLYIGGVPSYARVGKLLTSRKQYTGCMRRVRIDYFSVTPEIAIEVKSGVSANSCPLY